MTGEMCLWVRVEGDGTKGNDGAGAVEHLSEGTKGPFGKGPFGKGPKTMWLKT